MTSQSPRIYLYKITFEEVPYYYYGVHKEKKYNEYYMGSPITNKWCWELYTPKQQILEIFPFTDEGWLEAQKVEIRLIKPFYNTDKWCLNKNCGGIISLDTCSKAGKIGGNSNVKNNTGIFSLTKYQKQEIGRKWGKIWGKKTYELGIGVHSLSKEEKIQIGKRVAEKNKKNGTGIFSQSIEERKELGRKSGNYSKENGLGIFAETKEDRSKRAKKTNSQRWECTETGFVTNAGNLTKYQRAKGIDTSKRRRIS